MASGYHQLGVVAYLRGDYDQALDWYRQSLPILEKLGNRVGMASGYHQLGMIAELRGDYDQALDWYRQSLTIEEELGNRAGMATTISQIGALYTETGRVAEAVAYNVRSLSIRVELQSPQISIDLHWLGRQCQALGDDHFRRLLAEHLDPESIDTVITWLD